MRKQEEEIITNSSMAIELEPVHISTSSDRIVSLWYKVVVHSLFLPVHANTQNSLQSQCVYPLKNDCNRHFVNFCWYKCKFE